MVLKPDILFVGVLPAYAVNNHSIFENSDYFDNPSKNWITDITVKTTGERR
jgi:hypothetical protein